MPLVLSGTDGISTNGSNWALQPNSSGLVVKPYQPFAQASCNTTITNGKILLNANNAYRGGMSIDNTNNRVNVPVGGVYVIGYHHLGNSGTGDCQIEIRINGTAIQGSATQDTNSSNDSFGSQIVRVLAAGDYIEWWVIQNTSHGNSHYNSMWAFLLG
jgi:hypothetical protein